MANFIVQFLLKTEMYQEDMLNKRFEIGRKIYNSLVNITQKRYKEMIKTKKYRNLLSSLTGNKKTDKSIWKQINDIRKQYKYNRGRNSRGRIQNCSYKGPQRLWYKE